MKNTSAIPASLSAKIDALEASWSDLHKSALAESQGSGYSPAFQLILRIEDASSRFHKLISDLRGARSKRAAA